MVNDAQIDLNRVNNIKKPSTRIYYDLVEKGHNDLRGILKEFLAEIK